ncbi:hypothetical protein [Duncaniella sp.]|uniref:hypothetical protein n=1 Tax=Duncaniella sp. TaxID=2518496 RepID=UPI0023CC288A|nr:hypothetical protein [Duncaniella sp.]MDE5904267.1 hypothetical protein [Duncaniella sp.]
MKTGKLHLFLLILGLLICSSCERSGYYNDDQRNRLDLLTSVRWTEQSTNSYDPENPIVSRQSWSFDKKGKASVTYTWTDKNGDTVYNETQYYDWTFTTENFAVIYLYSASHGDLFWLIEKLTADELRVKAAVMDPVLNPTIPQRLITLQAAPR